jgi:RNase H-fold protein (predicted Holliday junction resolvase)
MRLVVDSAPLVERICELAGVKASSPLAGELREAAADAYKRLVAPACELDVTMEKKQESDRAAVEVFAENLRNLLLASPLGEKKVLAIDPGIRTGCKVAMLDATGKFLGNTVIYPMQKPDESREVIAKIVLKYKPEAVAVGNGTAGRETEAFVRTTLKAMNATGIIVVSVSESGASVYSASEIARDEFPNLDLTVRGAISIGRRLQDPLAELAIPLAVLCRNICVKALTVRPLASVEGDHDPGAGLVGEPGTFLSGKGRVSGPGHHDLVASVLQLLPDQETQCQRVVLLRATLMGVPGIVAAVPRIQEDDSLHVLAGGVEVGCQGVRHEELLDAGGDTEHEQAQNK